MTYNYAIPSNGIIKERIHEKDTLFYCLCVAFI